MVRPLASYTYRVGTIAVVSRLVLALSIEWLKVYAAPNLNPFL